MRALTDHEKRTLRIAAVAISLYLVLFYGVRGWKQLETRRTQYQQLVTEAQHVKLEMQRYENKALLKEKLKDTFRIDLAKLSKASLVGEASAAIQKAAHGGGVQLGPIRETPGSPSAKELASMQLEALGPVPAVMAFLHRLGTLGYPLIVESVQMNPDTTKQPGMVKLTLHLVIFDPEQWKQEEKRNA